VAYGINIENIYGSSIIDDYYSGYTVFAYKTLYIRNLPGGYAFTANEGVINVSNLPLGSIIAFKPPVGALISYWGNRVYSNSNVDLPYVILCPHSFLGPSRTAYGVRVYNRNKKVVFDTGNALLNTLNIYSYNSYNVPPRIQAKENSWIIPTTIGVVSLVATEDRNISRSRAAFLQKAANGDYDVRTDYIGRGPGLGLVGGSSRREGNYQISFIEVEIV
jgi:hypothetical protein